MTTPTNEISIFSRMEESFYRKFLKKESPKTTRVKGLTHRLTLLLKKRLKWRQGQLELSVI
jgi:hypothetical protein